MIKKVPRYLLTFFNTSGAIAVERFCKEREIPGRLIPVPREISARAKSNQKDTPGFPAYIAMPR